MDAPIPRCDQEGAANEVRQEFAVYEQVRPVLIGVLPLSLVAAATLIPLRWRDCGIVRAVSALVVDWLVLCSALSVAYLVLTPRPPYQQEPRVRLGSDLLDALSAAPGDAQPWVQLAGNLVLLLPLGLLIPLRVRWFDNLGAIALAGMLLSCSIELVQYFAVRGRIASADDVVLNTLGAAIGGSFVHALPRRDGVSSTAPTAKVPAPAPLQATPEAGDVAGAHPGASRIPARSGRSGPRGLGHRRTDRHVRRTPDPHGPTVPRFAQVDTDPVAPVATGAGQATVRLHRAPLPDEVKTVRLRWSGSLAMPESSAPHGA